MLGKGFLKITPSDFQKTNNLLSTTVGSGLFLKGSTFGYPKVEPSFSIDIKNISASIVL